MSTSGSGRPKYRVGRPPSQPQRPKFDPAQLPLEQREKWNTMQTELACLRKEVETKLENLPATIVSHKSVGKSAELAMGIAKLFIKEESLPTRLVDTSAPSLSRPLPMAETWTALLEKLKIDAASDPSPPPATTPSRRRSSLDENHAVILVPEDMSIFGHFPLTDRLVTVSCIHCDEVIKESAFVKHMVSTHLDRLPPDHAAKYLHLLPAPVLKILPNKNATLKLVMKSGVSSAATTIRGTQQPDSEIITSPSPANNILERTNKQTGTYTGTLDGVGVDGEYINNTVNADLHNGISGIGNSGRDVGDGINSSVKTTTSPSTLPVGDLQSTLKSGELTPVNVPMKTLALQDSSRPRTSSPIPTVVLTDNDGVSTNRNLGMNEKLTETDQANGLVSVSAAEGKNISKENTVSGRVKSGGLGTSKSTTAQIPGNSLTTTSAPVSTHTETYTSISVLPEAPAPKPTTHTPTTSAKKKKSKDPVKNGTSKNTKKAVEINADVIVPLTLPPDASVDTILPLTTKTTKLIKAEGGKTTTVTNTTKAKPKAKGGTKKSRNNGKETDMDVICAVQTTSQNIKGVVSRLLCRRSLSCKAHTLTAKRAVVGRTKSFDVLLSGLTGKPITNSVHRKVSTDSQKSKETAEKIANKIKDSHLRTMNPKPLAVKDYSARLLTPSIKTFGCRWDYSRLITGSYVLHEYYTAGTINHQRAQALQQHQQQIVQQTQTTLQHQHTPSQAQSQAQVQNHVQTPVQTQTYPLKAVGPTTPTVAATVKSTKSGSTSSKTNPSGKSATNKRKVPKEEGTTKPPKAPKVSATALKQ
eukprot:CFRG5225T1